MHRGLLPLNALRAFEATARTGRMGRAADELSVTHGAVSRQVRQLEAVLGCRLVEGPRHDQRLTQAGLLLAQGLTPAFEMMERATTAVMRRGVAELQVSCLATLLMRWLIPRLHRFKARHPEIDVRLSASDEPVAFAREHIDLAIRRLAAPFPDGTAAVPFLPEQVGPVLAPRLTPAGGVHGPRDLLAVPRLHTASRRDAWPDWMARVGMDGLAVDQGAEFEHFYFMLEAAAAGLGVAIGPYPLVADDLAAGRLVAPLGFVDGGHAYVAYWPRQGGHPAAAAFAAWLAEEGRATASYCGSGASGASGSAPPSAGSSVGPATGSSTVS
ncbi:MAG: LysR substrate-binding domain-containing protein [Alphaproteobacteria bacterium]